MSHNRFSRPPSFWGNTAVPTARDLGAWDAYQYKSLNGDTGGTYAPATPIVIGGAGVALSGIGSALAAGAVTSMGGRLVLGSSDYCLLSPTVTRTKMLQLVDAVPTTAALGIGGTTGQGNTLNLSRFGVSPVTTSGDFIVPIPSRYLHNGANLTGATLTCRALVKQPTAPTAAPYWMIANVFGMNASGSSSVQLVPTFAAWLPSHAYTVGSIVIPNNQSAAQTGIYYVATAISGTGTSAASPPAWPTTVGPSVIDNAGANQITWQAYGNSGVLANPNSGGGNTYEGGAVQSSVMTGNAALSTLTIDTTTYNYWLHVIYDSFGAGSATAPNWLFHALSLSFGNIVDMRPE